MGQLSDRQWTVGDLCTYHNPKGTGFGVLYRVEKIDTSNQHYPSGLLTLRPALGVFLDIAHRKRLTRIDPVDCKHMSLVDLATEYVKLGNFIAEEARNRGADVTAPDS